jgi:Fe-S cluster biosynthesis and repair protein YggX
MPKYGNVGTGRLAQKKSTRNKFQPLPKTFGLTLTIHNTIHMKVWTGTQTRQINWEVNKLIDLFMDQFLSEVSTLAT